MKTLRGGPQLGVERLREEHERDPEDDVDEEDLNAEEGLLARDERELGDRVDDGGGIEHGEVERRADDVGEGEDEGGDAAGFAQVHG